MIYNLLILGILLNINIGCTNKNPEKSQNLPKINHLEDFPLIEGNLDLGIIPNNQDKIVSVIFKNQGAFTVSPAISVQGNVTSIVYHNCLQIKKAQQCVVKLSIKVKDKPAGLIEDSLVVDDLVFPITGGIESVNKNRNYIFFYNGQIYEDHITLGTASKQSLYSITIKNIGNLSGNIEVPMLNNSNFQLISHSCVTALKPQNQCVVKIIFNPNNKNNENYSSILSYDGAFINIRANAFSLKNQQKIGFHCRQNIPGGIVQSEEDCVSFGGVVKSNQCLIPEGSIVTDIAINENSCAQIFGATGGTWNSPIYPKATYALLEGSIQKPDFDFGIVFSKNPTPRNLYIKNISAVPSDPSTIEISPPFVILQNACNNKVLKPQEACLFKIGINSENEGVFSSTLSFDTLSLNITGTVQRLAAYDKAVFCENENNQECFKFK